MAEAKKPLVPPNWSPADYRCQRCKRRWFAAAGPQTCPLCGHLYIDWLNYEEDFGRRSSPKEDKK